MMTDLCVEDSVHDSPREDTLQNISTDDLPDSASQTAQQHDSKFSFRSDIHNLAKNPLYKQSLNTLMALKANIALSLLLFRTVFLFCVFQ